jgi:hypothetical protein
VQRSGALVEPTAERVAERVAELSVALAGSFLTVGEQLTELHRSATPAALLGAQHLLTREERVDPVGSARARRLLDAALPRPTEHVAAFFERPSFLIHTAATFLLDGLRRGEFVVVVATAAHRDAFAEAIEDAGFGLERARADGRYLEVDADRTLATLRTDDGLDERRLLRGLGTWMAQATRCSRPARLYGEMVALLWAQGALDLATELEVRWERLTARFSLPVLCGWPMGGFVSDETAERFPAICAHHTGVTTDSYTTLATPEGAAVGSVVLDPAVPGGRPTEAPVGWHAG